MTQYRLLEQAIRDVSGIAMELNDETGFFANEDVPTSQKILCAYLHAAGGKVSLNKAVKPLGMNIITLFRALEGLMDRRVILVTDIKCQKGSVAMTYTMINL